MRHCKIFEIVEHQFMGAKLKALNAGVMSLEPACRNAYGVELAKLFAAADRAIGEIRSALDDKISSEYPMSTNWVAGAHIPHVYMGPMVPPSCAEAAATSASVVRRLEIAPSSPLAPTGLSPASLELEHGA